METIPLCLEGVSVPEGGSFLQALAARGTKWREVQWAHSSRCGPWAHWGVKASYRSSAISPCQPVWESEWERVCEYMNTKTQEQQVCVDGHLLKDLIICSENGFGRHEQSLEAIYCWIIPELQREWCLMLDLTDKLEILRLWLFTR